MGITKRRKQPHLFRTDARHAAADHVTETDEVEEVEGDSTDELTTSSESLRESLQRLDEVSNQLDGAELTPQ